MTFLCFTSTKFALLIGTKLITFPIQNADGETQSQNPKREWIMNPNGRSYICILHEYVQHALKKQPTYKFTELGLYCYRN